MQTQYQPVSPPPYQQISGITPIYQQPGVGYPPSGGGRLIVQPSGAQLALPSGKTEFIVGREDPASNNFPDVDLNDHGGDEGGVSRRHAQILSRDGQFYLEDLNSVNYTYVNRQKLQPNQPQPLNEGDEIQLGRVKLTFYR
jgi:pSer/pThr/pTyr-binding forkhead associated (FHA) protein